jgi:formylglycine-generating enzyme required for sulfatase activity
VLEALARDQPEEALQELTDPWLARLDRNEIEGVSIRAVQQYGRVYEHVRATQRPGVARTGVMGTMVAFVRKISMNLSFAPGRVIDLMRAKDAGSRIMGLAIAQGSPTLDYLDPAIYLIWDAISAFEQYHAMLVAAALLKYASLEQLVRLEGSLLGPKGIPMDSRDSSRTDLRAKMLREMDPSLASAPDYPFQDVEFSSSVQYEDDPAARHGPFVVTRGKHELKPIPGFQVGIYPVTNRLFHRFVRSDQNPRVRAQLLLIRRSKKVEPATWDSEKAYPVGTGDHPVSGIGYVEAVAFVDWVNANSPDSEWRWVLPTEDMWELAARSPRGLLYPWGNSFDKGKCNSAEVGINGPSEVGRFPEGQSWCGCSDMAGNVWEFVAQRPGSNTCVLRGGSYKNNQDEIKNCFRLQEVGVTLRAADFGFRCARVRNSSSISRDIPQAKVQAKENGLHEGRRSQGRTAKGTVKKAQKKKATPKLK